MFSAQWSSVEVDGKAETLILINSNRSFAAKGDLLENAQLRSFLRLRVQTLC
jgi:hypothetical protein